MVDTKVCEQMGLKVVEKMAKFGFIEDGLATSV